jgi:hypothetical protein
MHGSMIVIPADEDIDVIVHRMDRSIKLEELQAAVEGYIEIVPFFNTLAFEGIVWNCITFCNEYGKINDLPMNRRATSSWEMALNRCGKTLSGPGARLADHLVGSIVVIFGDKEFMKDFTMGDDDDTQDT